MSTTEPMCRRPHPPVPVSLREMARAGVLAEAARGATPEIARHLRAQAYELAWPVVFNRLTRRLEHRRGHRACAVSVRHLTDECLDRFHDDVEAVVTDLLAHARRPIANLEAWIASRLTAATVDGHRRRRGLRGALQRPRVPSWLAAALEHDDWLIALATEILIWVGTPTTAGAGLWPIDTWVGRRGAVTGDWRPAASAQVSRDIDRVLSAMRRRPAWCAAYVETPFGRKRPPLAPAPPPAATGPGNGGESALPPLPLTHRHQLDDAHLRGRATAAVDAIRTRLRSGADPTSVVTGVLVTVFADADGWRDIDRIPNEGAGADERLAAVLRDPTAIARIVRTVQDIIAVEDRCAA